MASIVNKELLEEELRAVVQAGGYGSKEEAIIHALEVLLAANPHLRVGAAIELYRQGGVTLSRAAEIAGSEVEQFKERLAEKGVAITVAQSVDDVLTGAEQIRRLRDARSFLQTPTYFRRWARSAARRCSSVCSRQRSCISPTVSFSSWNTA